MICPYLNQCKGDLCTDKICHSRIPSKKEVLKRLKDCGLRKSLREFLWDQILKSNVIFREGIVKHFEQGGSLIDCPGIRKEVI